MMTDEAEGPRCSKSLESAASSSSSSSSSLLSMSWKAGAEGEAVRDPIRLLRLYLSQLAAATDQGEKADETEGEMEPAQEGANRQRRRCRRRRRPLSARQLDDALRAADFLFGSGSGPSSAPHRAAASGAAHHHHHAAGLLDGALALLDACGCAETAPAGTHGDNAARGLGTSSSSSSSSLITRAVALPSRRSIYLVQGGSTTKAAANKRRRQQQQLYSNHYQDHDGELSGPHYLCLFPDDRVEDSDESTATSESREEGSSSCYYCSCRSFHDRSMRQLAPSANGGGSVPSGLCGAAPTPATAATTSASTTTATTVLCKHLLALVLRPYLDVPIRVLEFGTDEEFGEYVLDRIGV